MKPTEFRPTIEALAQAWIEVLQGGAYRDYGVWRTDENPGGQFWQISLEYYSEERDNSVQRPLFRFKELGTASSDELDVSGFFRRNEDLLEELDALTGTGALDEVEIILRNRGSGLRKDESLVLQVDALYGEGDHRERELREELIAIIYLHEDSLVCETMISQRKAVTTVDHIGQEITHRVPFDKERYFDRVIKQTRTSSANSSPYVFVLMSFEKAGYLVDAYDAIKRAVAEWDDSAVVERVDDIQDDFRITEKIQECIERADFVIADLTGERPNVYYEVGFSRGIEKRMIHTAREGTMIHFDLKDFNTILWDSARTLQRELVQRLKGMTRRAPT